VLELDDVIDAGSLSVRSEPCASLKIVAIMQISTSAEPTVRRVPQRFLHVLLEDGHERSQTTYGAINQAQRIEGVLPCRTAFDLFSSKLGTSANMALVRP